jgi:uncharacterized protein (TIGR02266 family)
MPDMPTLFRVYMELERRRKSEGLSPHELSHWSKLKRQLSRQFQPGVDAAHSDKRESVRVPLALKVNFESYGEIRECLMTNMSLGGVFIATTSPLPIGTPFRVRLRIAETGEDLELSGEVASLDVSADLSHEQRGMGIRFVNLSDDQRKQVSDLYEHALKRAILGD